jgi:hypothetical protein
MLKGVKVNPASNVQVLWQDRNKQLVLIECECGAKILLLPDLKEMNCAIEAHVAEHQKIGKVIYESRNHHPQNKTKLDGTSHWKSRSYGIIQGKRGKN